MRLRDNVRMNSDNLTPASPSTATLGKNDNNLVWLDCEMSGLDPEKERLLEIAIVVTDPDLMLRV